MVIVVNEAIPKQSDMLKPEDTRRGERRERVEARPKADDNRSDNDSDNADDTRRRRRRVSHTGPTFQYLRRRCPWHVFSGRRKFWPLTGRKCKGDRLQNLITLKAIH